MNVRTILKDKHDEVYTIRPDQTVGEAADLLSSRRIGVALVTEGSDVVGVLSERDIVNGVSRHRGSALAMPVRMLMTSPVVTCRPDDRIKDIMEVMTSRRIRHLPVVEDGAVIGMVSIGDVIKHRLAETQMEVAVLRDVALAAR